MGQFAALEQMLKPVVQALGFELWGIEQRRGGDGQLLRLYIDAESGISVDDCAKVSRQVSSVLDVENPIRGAYTLEVSSPGMDRLLFGPEHYAQALGERVKVQLKLPVDGRRRYVGNILTVNEQELQLLVDEGELALPFATIERVRIVPTIPKRTKRT